MKFTRLFTGNDGQSHFEEGTIEFSDSIIGKMSNPIAVDHICFGEVSDTAEIPWHNPPVHQFVIMLHGAMEIEVGDGSKRTFNVGDVLLAEDVTGQGHITRAAGSGKHTYVVIPKYSETP